MPDTPAETLPDTNPQPGEPSGRRPRYRPPVGIPLPKEKRAGGVALSVAVHLLLVLLIALPFLAPELLPEMMGAGGPGPAGGGGGGSRGSGGGKPLQERIQYVVPPRPPTPTDIPQLQPPEVVPPEPEPEPEPEPVTPPPEPTKAEEAAEEGPATAAASPLPGTGGGTGNDGSGGTGPGSGGGVGSGVGTGRGSSVGPGTGGGSGTVYPPSPTELFIPPIPTPNRVKGFRLVAIFDVDSTGKVVDFEFNPTRDGDYNRKLRQVLANIRFRPAVTGDGRPVSSKASVEYTF